MRRAGMGVGGGKRRGEKEYDWVNQFWQEKLKYDFNDQFNDWMRNEWMAQYKVMWGYLWRRKGKSLQ